LNDNGNALFWAFLNDATDGHNGLFLGSTQTVSQIARAGQSVPQVAGEFDFPGVRTLNHPLLPLNDNDQALFPSDLTGVDNAEDNGLFLGAGTPESIIELVREGDPAPDGAGGFNGEFGEFSNVFMALNDAGQAAFAQDNLGNTNNANSGADDFGIFRADASGSVVQIAREGDSPPGSDETFFNFTRPFMNDAGQVAFAADVGVGWSMVLRGDGASTTVIAEAGQMINAAGDTFRDIESATPINAAGQVAFIADIETGGAAAPRGVFVSDGATLIEIARTGQDLGGGESLQRIRPHLTHNESGQVTFKAEVRTVAGNSVRALFRGDSAGNLVEIARLEQRVPAGDAIFFFSFTGHPFPLNDEGQVAFSANLLEDDGDRHDAIFFYDDEHGLVEIAREGETLGGAEITRLFFSLPPWQLSNTTQPNNRDGLNNRGEVAFWFQLDNGNEGVAVVDPLAPTILDVDTFDDVVDPADGVTSLREAIIEANASAGNFEIHLQAGAYWLTESGADENAAATGDLDILGNGSITIVGAGAGQTVIHAGGDGGANPALGDRVFHVLRDATLSVEGVTITGGTATGAGFDSNGGGILNEGTLAVTGSTISRNSAGAGGDGGGIFNTGIFNNGRLTVTGSTLSGNAAIFGGGIANNGRLTVTGSTLSGNSAVFFGGGILNVLDREVTVTGSTFAFNSADRDGGGISNAGTLTVTSSTLIGNRADADGNDFGAGGGILTSNNSSFPASTTLSNTIVAGNFVGTGTDPNDLAEKNVEAASSFNLIGDANSAGGLTNGTNGNIVGVDVAAVLDTTLADNGGPTLTHALLAGGPAVDTGDPNFDPADFDPPLVHDQRGEGFDRVIGDRIDIGAVELQTTPPQVPGRVWLDADANGLLDAAEAGIEDVVVRLRAASDNALLDETTTDDQGAYVLEAPAEMDVFVEFVAPERHIYTLQNVGEGANEDVDSDAARGAGTSVTDTFTLNATSPAPPQGAGLVPLTAAAPSQNPVTVVDVDNNGLLSLNDVLVVVTHLRNQGFGAIEGEPDSMHEFVDVTGDNERGLDDLLAVVNAIRESLVQGAGEGEADAAEDIAPLWPEPDARQRAILDLFEREEPWL
ncbi:MAG: hypothetical protein KY475_20065, partial [Planctomycetes bacterium]|nr:hypothetical protein [Planctomycetota bacterium]